MEMGFSFNLPAPSDALSYLRGLTPVSQNIYDGIDVEYRKNVFVVPGIDDYQLVAKILAELVEAMQNGAPQRKFDASVNKLTDEVGMERIADDILNTAYNTYTQKSYSLIRYRQMREPDTMRVLPFWQYMTMGDDRVRPEHAVLDGFVARAIDPVWHKIYPPNGFNCRCHVIALLAREAPKDANESGLLRLPLLAQMKVPESGFGKVF